MAHTIKSPLPGTFYRRPNPAAETYVDEGDEAKSGDVGGLVENEDLVDAGQDIIELEAG